MGSLHNIDFGVFWASWAVPGRNRVPEPVLGDRFRWVPTGFAVPRNQVPDTKAPGSEGCVHEVSKVSVFDGFRRLGSVPEVWMEPVLGTSSGNPRY